MNHLIVVCFRQLMQRSICSHSMSGRICVYKYPTNQHSHSEKSMIRKPIVISKRCNSIQNFCVSAAQAFRTPRRSLPLFYTSITTHPPKPPKTSKNHNNRVHLPPLLSFQPSPCAPAPRLNPKTSLPLESCFQKPHSKQQGF